MLKLLVIEDDTALALAIEQLLREEGYDVSRTGDGETGLHLAASGFYDGVILDAMIPGMDGFTLLRELRRSKQKVPVIMLTARATVEDRVKGLDAGADDYLVKPFATTELAARVRALLRRHELAGDDADTIGVDTVTLRRNAREVSIGQDTFVLPPKEAALLELFLRHPRQVLTREQLMDRLWGYEADVLENTLETYVSKLRKRLEGDGCPVIQTVRGLGYRLQTRG
ncbi:MAG: response regulator transcription factor [Bacilli bacterium]